MMRLRAAILILAIFSAIFSAFAGIVFAAPASAAQRAVVLNVDGPIGPAIADYIVRELQAVSPEAVGLVVLRMNTPGGLDTSMRKIISAILASLVPVATFVAPSGARAASAGTYIAYASAIAAMAPGTNIGAATPVQLGGGSLFPGSGSDQKQKGKNAESGDTETRKIINDATAYIRGLATINARNADWAADAVRSAASVPASEALSLHVIDVIAKDVPDLLHQIDGRTVIVDGKPQRLATAALTVETVPPGWLTELFALVTDPDVAFILMLVGIYGIVLEFFSPGAVAPGLIGSISVVIGAAIGSAALILLVLAALFRSRKRPIVTGGEALIGAEGEAVAWQDSEGRVRVQGEVWQARATAPLLTGTRVKVVGRDGLVLLVEAVRPA